MFKNFHHVRAFQLWKKFLLEPLDKIFNCFTNPAQSKYAWTGQDEAEDAYITESH